MAVANSYAEGWREWDERYADLVIGKRNWQIVAAAFAAVSIVLAVGMVWQSARSRYVPYIVEVDKLGYALTQAQPLTAASPPDVVERIERYEVASFIRQARSVSSDAQVEHEALNSLLAHTGGAADSFLDQYYHADHRAHDPFHIGQEQRQTVSVEIDSILKLSANSYEVRWTEVRRDSNGADVGLPTHWEADLQTEIVGPHDGEAIVSNPLGFCVTNITWTEQQG